ncbi:hypothetical protein A9Q91_02950 [Candidatus Gracilibacteria bacterium 28_42_T64]|nr:hypothetical protein A9Q91_02950 [Candidatus Gracilibacteria bacterium 28_42_T64]
MNSAQVFDILRSQMISFSLNEDASISVGDLSNIYNIYWIEPTDTSEKNKARMMLNSKNNNITIFEEKGVSSDDVKEYVVLTNRIRTFLKLEKYADLIDYIESSDLIFFVDEVSIELLKTEMNKVND